MDFRVKCDLEADMKKLLEPKKLYGATYLILNTTGAKIIFKRAPFIQYQQILLDKILDST